MICKPRFADIKKRKHPRRRKNADERLKGKSSFFVGQRRGTIIYGKIILTPVLTDFFNASQ